MHKFSGMTVAEILRQKKASVRTAPLPAGSPEWDDLELMSWEEIDAGAKANEPGLKTVRKLLTDRRFDR
jgi:hypothetical protein